MTAPEQAETRFKAGFNCAQAVFAAFAPELGMNEATALKTAACFGGGLARRGEVCGAVSGALMALGLKIGNTTPNGPPTKEEVYKVAHRFLDEFKKRHGNIICRDLLGCDLSTPEGLAQAKEKQLWSTLCPVYVREAAEIVESLLREQ